MLNLTNVKNIQNLLASHGIKPKKSLGQHFLINQSVVDKMIQTAEITPKDTILEIGPGLGILTQTLCQKAEKVIAIEIDPKMVEILKKTCGHFKNLKIINNDILSKSIDYQLSTIDYKLVSSLPYQITSPVIRKFLEAENKPQSLTLLIQKEMAQRITAKPGNRERGFLTVLVEFYSQTEIVAWVDKNNFWPKPKVDSAIIKISIRSQFYHLEPKSFFRIVQAGFSTKRRQIHNSLAGGLHLPKEKILDTLVKANIDPKRRAETLTLNEWIELYNLLTKRGD